MAGDRDLLERCLKELDNPTGNSRALRDAIRKRLEEIDPGTSRPDQVTTEAGGSSGEAGRIRVPEP